MMGTDRLIRPCEGDAPDSQIGATLASLYGTIGDRREAGEGSYTWRLLNGPLDALLKKVDEEALECALASKDLQRAIDAGSDDESDQLDHLRYECGDLLYHTLVLAARFGIGLDELAAELNQRMAPEERPKGCVLLKDEHVKRRL